MNSSQIALGESLTLKIDNRNIENKTDNFKTYSIKNINQTLNDTNNECKSHEISYNKPHIISTYNVRTLSAEELKISAA